MQVVLWDTRKLDASKDFAGGFGVGQYPGGGGVRGKIIRHFYKRDRRPAALLMAHLAAVFGQLGHRVHYVEDHIENGADLYVFCPSLITLHLERRAIARVKADNPTAQVLVCGLLASVMPEAFDGLDVTIVKGEAEQLLWRLDEVLARPGGTVNLGTIEDLDRLPMPDWSLMRPRGFRIGYDFWRFPTALIQASRGCTFKCNYCPYIILDNSTRFRDPEAVAAEMENGIRTWGFRSFKFRDPLFGLKRNLVYELAERIGRLPKKIQFSIETRIELVPPEVLKALKEVGLTSITVGMETPADDTLRKYNRKPIRDDRQHEFISTCREMGIRTVAGFLIGFPEDDEAAIRRVMNYANKVNPTFGNFNVVTPYPGTEFFEEIKDQIADFDFSRYTVYNPVLKYENFTAEEVAAWHAKCFNRFYFRWDYLAANAHLLWPWLGRFGIGRRRGSELPEDSSTEANADPAHQGVPRPRGVDLLRKKGLRKDGPHQHGISQRSEQADRS